MAIGISVFIHSIFCIQAVIAADGGGMILNMFFYILFLPQVILIYFLPPEFPLRFNAGHWDVNWWGFGGKLADAYIASLVYGWVIASCWAFLRRRSWKGVTH